MLAVLAAFAVLCLAFARIVDEVMEKDTHAFDEAVLLALRVPDDLSRPWGPRWLEKAFLDITSLGSPTVITIMTVIAVAYLVTIRRVRMAALLAASVSIGGLVEQFLKYVFDRARPDVVPHLSTVTSLSFPSGHAMLSAIAFLSLGALLARAQTDRRTRAFVMGVSVALTVAIGISRVYLGVHWPTDVLAGWLAGSIWALMFWVVAVRLGA